MQAWPCLQCRPWVEIVAWIGAAKSLPWPGNSSATMPADTPRYRAGLLRRRRQPAPGRRVYFAGLRNVERRSKLQSFYSSSTRCDQQTAHRHLRAGLGSRSALSLDAVFAAWFDPDIADSAICRRQVAGNVAGRGRPHETPFFHALPYRRSRVVPGTLMPACARHAPMVGSLVAMLR